MEGTYRAYVIKSWKVRIGLMWFKGGRSVLLGLLLKFRRCVHYNNVGLVQHLLEIQDVLFQGYMCVEKMCVGGLKIGFSTCYTMIKARKLKEFVNTGGRQCTRLFLDQHAMPPDYSRISRQCPQIILGPAGNAPEYSWTSRQSPRLFLEVLWFIDR